MSSAPGATYEPDFQRETHLREYINVLLRRRRLVLAVFLAVAGSTTVRSLLTRPVYQASAQILIERESPSVLSFKEVAQADAGRDDYYQTQYKLLQSRAIVRRVIENMGLLQDPEFGGPRTPEQIAVIKAAAPGASSPIEGAIDTFLRRLRIQPVRNSRLVSVGFEAFRPELAADAVNKLAQFYIRQALEFRYQTSSEAGQWLGQQIEAQRRKAEEAEISLQQLKEREGILYIEERRTLLDQRLKEQGTALTSLSTLRLERQALYNQMKNAPNPQQLPEVMRSGVVQSLRIDLANLERLQAQMLEKYMDQHPEFIKVRIQIEETRSKIWTEAQNVIRSAENDYKAAAAQEASVASALEAAKAEALELSRRSVQYDTLKREAEASKQVLNSLLERHKQTDVAQELTASNIRIVDPAAVPRGPARPQHAQDIFKGVLWGLGLAIGLAFLRERLDNALKSPEDVRVHLGAPLLGVIPETKESSALVLSRASQGPLAEGYRVVRTALGYSWPESQPRTIIVTSTAPGEGKTLTAVNLALTLAFTGGKVLLIDADLRKPQAHNLLHAKRTPGLSDIVVGKAKPSETIQRLPTPGLSFLGSGTSAPSPADLMTTQALHGFVEGLRGFYNWIVIDTPPVGIVVEPLILAAFSDGVVVVAGAEMVPRDAVRHTLERIAQTGARILGVVLNRARIDKRGYDYGPSYGHYGSHGGYAGQDPDRSKVAKIDDRRAAR